MGKNVVKSTKTKPNTAIHLEQKNRKLQIQIDKAQKKILTLENKILKLENKTLKQERQILKLEAKIEEQTPVKVKWGISNKKINNPPSDFTKINISGENFDKLFKPDDKNR